MQHQICSWVFRIPFDPRSKNQRKRRDADSDYSSRKPPVQPEVLTMFRAIEVFLPDDGAVPMGTKFAK